MRSCRQSRIAAELFFFDDPLSRPKATFVTRLQPLRSPARAARQLPDQSTTLRMESSSTDDPRLGGALPIGDICSAAKLPRSVTNARRFIGLP